MIELKEKEECCGCTACASVCPRKCIEMYADSEGFLYPEINKTNCIECNLCKKVCPTINTKPNGMVYGEGEDKKLLTEQAVNKLKDKPQSYVCYIKNNNIRRESTSGGFFSAIAQIILQRNGVVFGAAVNCKGEIEHKCITSFEKLGELRGSKYVQSSQNDIYEQIKNYLLEDRWVLYTGTPCQVAGLKSFLREPYEKLVCVDIFCHGVGSPLYWNKYRTYMEKKYGAKIKTVRFREKTYGYNSACMAVYFENGKSSHRGHDDDLYWSAFSKCFIFRPSCYNCHFKSIYHEFSDFSIGDFWNTKELGDDFKQANGCSLVLIHSEKAKKIFKELSGEIIAKQVNLEQALLINGGWQPSKLFTSSKKAPCREQLFNDLNVLPLNKVVDKYIPLSVLGKIKCGIKPWLYQLGLLEKFKNIMGG